MAEERNLAEESKDLSTCCVCFESYDLKEHKPKFLPCSHTYCLTCIKKMVPLARTRHITCPVCKKVCDLPAKKEELPNNLFAMHIIVLNDQIKLNNERKNLLCWCETCQGPVKPNCCKEKHQLRDLLKDVHESQGLVVGTSVKLKESRQKRSQVKVHLLNKKKKLQCELKSVDVELAENENGQHELSEMISNCEQLQNLLPVDKVQAFLQKNRLELTMQRFKEVGKEADKTYKLIVEQSGMDEGKSFAFNCSSIHRQKIDPEELFYCRDLVGQSSHVGAMDFSQDGRFLVSGGGDKIVRLWSLNNLNPLNRTSLPNEMNTKHESVVISLTMSPDSRRIFSGGIDKKIIIHDVATAKMLYSVAHPETVWTIACMPGTNGCIFATACQDGAFRLFDSRTSNTVPVLQASTLGGELRSVSFSPLDPKLVATAGGGGIQLFDIRQKLVRILHSITNVGGSSTKAEFNLQGTRLLCKEYHLPVVYDIPTCQSLAMDGKMKLTADGFNIPIGAIRNNCCFAGTEHQLVVSASGDHELYVWSLPEYENCRNRIVRQPLLVFSGHKSSVLNVRYCPRNDMLASSGREKAIKLWIPV